jgi:hypothetical protein
MPLAEDTIAALGSLQSVNFKGVGPGGADIYNVKFERGSLEWRIFSGCRREDRDAVLPSVALKIGSVPSIYGRLLFEVLLPH